MKWLSLITLLFIGFDANASVFRCGFDELPTFIFDASKNRITDITEPRYFDEEGYGIFVRCGIIWNPGEELGEPYCGFSSKSLALK